MSDIRINAEQRLYVIPCGAGFTCLGFDVAENWRKAYNAFTGREHVDMATGTHEHYAAYYEALNAAAAHSRETGKRCESFLSPQLRGLEGRRVEVLDCYGERRRFNVGKSTGWAPIHLEIARRGSLGGHGVTGMPFQSVTVIR